MTGVQTCALPILLTAANDDPYCEASRSQQLAKDWGARFVDAGPGGHLNAESGLGDWPEGRELLESLSKR